MARRLTKSTRALIETLEPSVQRAFRRSVKDLVDNVNFAKLRKAIDEKDLSAAEEAINSDDAFAALEDALTKAFRAGGTMTMNIIAEEARQAGRG